MPNPNHLPAGRPDGGQFTFASVGSYGAGGGIPYSSFVHDPDSLPDSEIIGMYEGIRSVGLKDADVIVAKNELYAGQSDPRSEAERQSRLKDGIRSLYFDKATVAQVYRSIQVATHRYQDTIDAGGQVKALANDDGSYQIVHTTNNSVSGYMDSLGDIRGKNAVVYNQRTGTLRRGAFCVPVGKARRVASSSVNRGRRNRLTETARETSERQGKVASEINRRITDSTTQEGRRLGSDDYAGRMTVSVFRDDNGDLYIQDCILCERHERKIADMYAKELGSSVFRATRPTNILNPDVGDNTALHANDITVVGSDFGGMSAGVVRDTGRRSQVPDEVANRMFAQHDELRKQRDAEYLKAHGVPRPEKTEEQREHERALDKARRLRRNRAKREREAGREPIKVKGGWLFKGEAGYDEARENAVKPSMPHPSQMFDSHESAKEAVEGQQRRQIEKASARERKRLQRERDKTIKNALSQGLKAVKYRVNDQGRGQISVAVEGTPEYEKAVGMKTAQVFEPK